MKLKSTLLTFISAILLLTSCMEAANNRRDLDSDEDSQTSGKIVDNPTAATWFAKGEYTEGPITLNSSDTGTIYLVGGVINNYIVSQEKTNSVFCLVGSINNVSETSAVKKGQVRLKAIPVRSTTSQEYSLRVSISSVEDNKLFCSGDNIISYDSAGNSYRVDDGSIGDDHQPTAYSLGTICETCTTTFPTTALTLNESNNGVITNSIVPTNTINLENLSILINSTNTSTDTGGSCTNNGCQLQGYDCCLNGQCVKDGEVRPNIDENSSEYKNALAEILNDANAFQNYPELFFVCPIHVEPGEDDTEDDSDPIDEANQQLLKDIADYKCLLGQTDQCETDFDTVRVKVWQKCGCQYEPTYVSGELQLDARCIDYGLKAEKDAKDNIINITCDIPTTENEDKPFQNLSVLVSGKSAPHRFFGLSGVPYDDLTKIPEGTNQEGDTFFYLDESNKAGPIESSYSINSVIGQMTLDLQQAHPAKVVDIEVDNMYIISVTSGYATPCPYCQQDAWQKVFSSNPESDKGYGLTWRGYTTDRASIGTNTTYGNYEDTIFGRACWLPPTMLPFSHKAYPDAGNQRRNRLEAQTAMYVNGYQRDWYGFNQGALIGSFDGNSWFAIGAGRRVRSTTKKLFLAINAPFADLSLNTNYTVSVVEDLGGQTAADYDWDFTKAPSATGQNYGASCQYMHACNVDSDCVAKLGWEYACAQVTDMRTNWPKFDIDAFERNNYAKEAVSLASILTGNISSGQNMRCVYRGAGAPCKLNPTDDVRKTSQSKLLTCAPNFRCAPLNSTSFSKELIRSPNEPTAILFGQAASILGRPIKYNERGEELPASVRQAISENLSAYSQSGVIYDQGDVGLCVPGRSVDTTKDFQTRHQTAEENGNADYISQIAACDENATGVNRTRSCPVFDDEGNFSTVEDVSISLPSVLQNMCSAASIGPDQESVFKSIEAPALKDLLQLPIETLAANACLRRAGAVCHTDLDCGPNRLHADIARGLAPESFGGTIAEQKFWEESLVCGQSAPEPLLNTILAADYYKYDMGKNRCCREISKDFTMYTPVGSASRLPGYDPGNELLTAGLDSNNGNNSDGRYSRYLASDSYKSKNINIAVDENSIPVTGQSLVINETGQSNCCGGGFIRKFVDGTNNWTSGSRLTILPSNLACLNYTTKSWKEHLTNKQNWLLEYPYMSAISGHHLNSGAETFVWLRNGDPIGGLQSIIKPDLSIPPEGINSDSPIPGTINLYPADADGALYDNQIAIGLNEQTGVGPVTQNALYSPIITRPNDDFNNPIGPTLGKDNNEERTLAILVPDYMDPTSINNVRLNYIRDPNAADFSDLSTYTSAAMTQRPCSSLATAKSQLIVNSGDSTQDFPAYCILIENGYRYMLFRINSNVTVNDSFELGWVSFDFAIIANAFGTKPGGQKYYESILERYELLGVPQMTYQALRCNDENAYPNSGASDVGKLVEGVYNSVTDPFETQAIGVPATPGVPASIDREVYYKTDGSTISLPQIFSADEFKCCSKLGSNVTDPGSMCCSGFGVLNTNNTYECRLPSGTDINVYLNLFISSEGIVTDNPDMSLSLATAPATEVEYDFRTGFPDISKGSVQTKIEAIGEKFCQLGTVKKGTAFGEFSPQPAGGIFSVGDELAGEYNSIVDSMEDQTIDNPNVYTDFVQKGLRWNHHTYCD